MNDLDHDLFVDDLSEGFDKITKKPTVSCACRPCFLEKIGSEHRPRVCVILSPPGDIRSPVLFILHTAVFLCVRAGVAPPVLSMYCKFIGLMLIYGSGTANFPQKKWILKIPARIFRVQLAMI